MNEAPKKLAGRELLKHAAELHAALDRGETIQVFITDWRPICDPSFSGNLWLYRVAPMKIVMYVNIYPDGPHESRQAADLRASSSRIACVRIEYHEGQYDE